MNLRTDTITAIATAPGRGGIGIVRVSGPLTQRIAKELLGDIPVPRHATYRAFRAADGSALDRGIALYFSAPDSYTGEEVLELQGHGSPIVLDMLLERLLTLGARLARPGEFSERAFLNDRIDLAQAEAIADLIDSGSRAAARSAMRSLEGEFSARITALVTALTELRIYVEAAIDFSDEEIDFLADDTVRARVNALLQALDQLTIEAHRGNTLREGLRIVIAGRPNAGKSSLLNRLAKREAAIVSDIPGTTRDVLREYIAIDGLPLHIIDTAGLRDSTDPLERIGIDRAHSEIAQADRVLLVIDDSNFEAERDTDVLLNQRDITAPITLIHNKCDLSGAAPEAYQDAQGRTHIRISARSGAGLELLAKHLKDSAGYTGTDQSTFIARRRHLEALSAATRHITNAKTQLEHPQTIDLAAEDLRLAQNALGEITGEVTSEELLGKIFSSFCIGK
jgi:tRNA modification GTPase